jgi:hypothetical protein
MTAEYLFPVRQTRRDFLTAAMAGTAMALTGRFAHSAPSDKPVTIGSGATTFTLDESWGKLPDKMNYGLGCAVVVDSKDRVFVTSRSANCCVAIFDKDGKLLETWTKDFSEKVGMTPQQVQATAHGLYYSKEGDGEFLYWTENVAGKIGARVYKTDMQGKVLYTLGNVAAESDTAKKVDWTNPTDVAVAANGDIYVVDGYGSQKLYRFDKSFKHIKTIGGKGKDHGQFNTCHGVWVSTLRKEPELYIADRANGRIEVFDLELTYKRTINGFRAPCCFYQHDGLMYVPELGARVSIIDANDKVVAQMGDGQGVKAAEIDKHPDKFATPHALTVASNGDLYVVEWVGNGRPRKFKKAAK